MVRKLKVAQDNAWLKLYGPTGRVRIWLNAAWNFLTHCLGIGVLRSPAHHAGADAKTVERRRLAELKRHGARVPSVLGEGKDTLLLTDLGSTLASQLRQNPDEHHRNAMVARVARAIADVHRRGAYLGQAFPRNITLRGDDVGFIDFEEDPGDIMSVAEAQARDWVMFSAGVARFYRHRENDLAAILSHAARDEAHEVRLLVAGTAHRLSFLESRWLRLRSTAAFRAAIRAMRTAFASHDRREAMQS
ncbi:MULTISPECIES: lipopolysaccharide kinase InaA family protein [Dyella]|uniref:Serine/threonine protein phosphatase n=2 Tax=Dyella TaxID=231454 RepID=A0A4R0YTD9_9GAMM|nr:MULTISPECIES: lipopolysaccharide kinase InaA family protein [Dyella]TBR39777.1 serine/threonine protein phosphatase [Dyella terrae]TCI12643.1 serine/threonine protein phosphatase [Dyella soli]